MHPSLRRTTLLCWIATAAARPLRVPLLSANKSDTSPLIVEHVGGWTELDCYRYEAAPDQQPPWDLELILACEKTQQRRRRNRSSPSFPAKVGGA